MAITRSITVPRNALTLLIKTQIVRKDGGNLNREVFDAIGKLTADMMGPVAQALKSSAVEGMEQGLRAVGSQLKIGFSGSAGQAWKPLTPKWVKRKVPRNKDKFWLNKGDLAFGYTSFATSYIAALRSAKTVVKPRPRRNTFGGKTFSYEIGIQLPGHRLDFITAITRDSFLKAKPFGGRSGPGGLSTFEKIGFLEGEGKSHRPFIAKLMAAKGVTFRLQQKAIINRAVARSGKLKTK